MFNRGKSIFSTKKPSTHNVVETTKPASPRPPAVTPKQIIVRITSRDGMFRIEIMNTCTIKDLIEKFSTQVHVNSSEVTISPKPEKQGFPLTSTLADCKFENGTRVFANYSEADSTEKPEEGKSADPLEAPAEFSAAARTTRILVDEDAGSDSSGEEAEQSGKCTHPPSMKCPKCTKSRRYVELQRHCPLHPPWGSCVQCQEWKHSLMPTMKRQTKRKCKQFSLSQSAGQAFASFAITYGERFKRIGIIYGRETPEKGVEAEFIYEPPQLSTAEGVGLLPDPLKDKMAHLAAALGMKRVGWVFSHDVRESPLTAQEAIQAARFQIEDGHRFTTLALTLPDKEREKREREKREKKEMQKASSSSTPSSALAEEEEEEKDKQGMSAYQVSMQLTRIIRRGIVKDEQEFEDVIETKEPVLVEMKETNKIQVEFGLVVVPITSFESRFTNMFPISNRPIYTPSNADLKEHLLEAKKRKELFLRTISDIPLLIYLLNVLDEEIVLEMAKAAASGTMKQYEGFELVLRSMAGLD
ncbi:putative Nuclear pore localization 4 (Npl4) [Monocercomonoides exilis]|uniref:putative Nuclear pore localization 4 (Npl4) n=1 Tax=Monocercomonoides exilis TaxID=2049356 RepID=UPI00355AC7A8|nr:putative Nuclear pore localization 4 (Npl4) [Monocercomonoides exilis]|eukprot:MONOS_1854.1-p1 / transcript=MONOS_1854.1 / gene=MONOS_1854 / organism=Monocercomonoides_exilis_PA203 / gene_product=Nuclear pore localization 4 (Npl4) / transcript_product=Nuclear pore localization 4 (Npl4) / location=Mono_scaffold00035:43386-45381(-) / protein_length=528 / sequence_SO=supercontig / SO=protein_coding / is_pseudo=false